ncbi:MAG TPA: AMP-binding protein [Egibacteraceae bacterium]|nr:AMP-binding protein [Egibacteraceae bacterium]
MTANGGLHARLRQAGAARSDVVAMTVDGRGELTYGAWQERADALARGLRREGIPPGERVALRFDAASWREYAAAYVAVQRAGAVPVPLPGDLAGPALNRTLHACGVSVVVGADGLPLGDAGVPTVAVGDLDSAGRGLPPVSLDPPGPPAELLAVPHPLAPPEIVTRTPDVRAGPWGAGDAPPCAPPLLHAFPPGTLAGQDALFALLADDALPSVVLPVFAVDRWCALVSRRGITACALHPAAAHAVLESGLLAVDDVAHVTRLVLASGGVSAGLLTRLAVLFPRAALVLVDVLGHGPAVRTVILHDRARPGAAGRPGRGTRVAVVDPDGQTARPGQVGRVSVLAGEASSPVWTGDVGYVEGDGLLYLVSGRHDVVVHRGASVCKAEVAHTLRAHPDVVDAAVLGLPDDAAADTVAAAVALRSGTAPSALQAWVGARIGEANRPGAVYVVDHLPRNRAGVLLAAELRRRLGRGTESAPAIDVAGAAGEPAPAERAVTATWRRVLGRRDIRPTDDFFSLGGDPLAGRLMLDLVEEACGVRVPYDAFASAPTVAGLTVAVERQAPAPEGAAAPVAFSQEGMLWHEHFAPGCQNLPGLARRYRGPLDAGALTRALDEIVGRHEPLRTTFALTQGRLVQHVRPHRPMRLTVVDLADVALPERDEEVARRVAEAGRRPFDLTADAMFVPTLLRLGPEDHVLVIRTHHSVFDDWSVGVFRRELAALYAAFAAGRASPLPALPLGFRDFARAQRRRLAGPAGTREMAFWRRELAGAPFTTQLPVDDPARPEGTPQAAGEPVSLDLPAEVHAGLRAFARGHRATVFMVMLAAYGVLVHRFARAEDLLLATVVANRNRTEHEGLIGCFTKKVPLRLQLGGDPPFTDVVARTRTALLGALSHQDLAFETMVQGVLAEPAAAHGLVPHVALVFQGETPREELALPGSASTGFATAASARRAHFAAEDGATPDQPAVAWGAGLYQGTFVIVSVAETDDALSCVARGAFHGPAVRRLLDSYATLLADAVADPSRPASRLRILDERDAAQVVGRARGPASEVPAVTVHDAFRAQARRIPQAVAVRTPTRAITYADLDARSDRIAGRLQAAGVEPGATVGIALGPSTAAVVAALAVWKAGAAWVALDPVDERLPQILAKTAAGVVVGDDPHGSLSRYVPLRAAELVDDTNDAPPLDPPALSPDATATVFFGSGASAVPDGVALDHRNLLHLAAGLRGLLPQGGDPRRIWLPAPTRDGFVRQLVALLDGHRLCVGDDGTPGDPKRIVALAATGMIDLFDCAPEEASALLQAGLPDALERAGRADAEPVLVVGGRRGLDQAAWRRLRGATTLRSLAVYGPPQCAFAATAAVVSDHARPVAGRPLANMDALVLDTQGRPVPPWATGELHLGGPGVMPAVSAPAPGPFVQTPARGAAPRLWPTGQLARALPDGTVELLGSRDAVVDLRGFRVDAERVRAAVLGVPGVRGAAVTVHRDEHGDPALVAHVVPEGRPPSVADVRRALWARLPGYACPAAIVVAVEGPGADPTGSADGSASPETTGAGGAARVLTALWADVLGVDEVPADGNYWQRFSFLEVLARAREAGLPVAAAHVTRNRTVDTLAADIAANRPPSATVERSPG